MEWPTNEDLKANGGEIIRKIEGFDPGEVKFRIVKAFEAKNYDGTPSGFVPGTPEGERRCIEKETIREGVSTYSNRW